MPVGYGGGINSIDVARNVFNCGVEKLIFNTSLLNFDFIKSLVDIYGSQSVVGCIDFKRNFWGGFNLYTHSGRIKIKYDLLDFVRKVIDVGVGEIILQSIDKEGTMKGYDLEALLKVTDIVEIPVVASGGAGDFSHFLDAIYKANSSAVAAGSLFVFKGSQKGILINYPKQSFLKELFNINLKN
jgi:cyclase